MNHQETIEWLEKEVAKIDLVKLPYLKQSVDVINKMIKEMKEKT